MERDRVQVLKFGGSVLQGRASLPAVAQEIERFVARGVGVVAVVSALRGRTDLLLAECAAAEPPLSALATAARVASGERECAALLAEELARRSASVEVQDPAAFELRAAGDPLDAEPVGLSVPRLRAALLRSRVVVVPGFVAVDAGGRTVLLGRGGSDLSALVLARALGAPARLVKDVDGLFDRDPANGAAQLVRSAAFDDVRAHGGRLVQPKALAYAMRHGLAFEIAAIGSDAPTVVGRAGKAADCG